MDWTFLLVVAGTLGLWILWQRIGLVRTEAARQYLTQGAQVIDVRSVAEYQAAHLQGTRNIPLGDLRERLPKELPDRSTILLLHCASGGRSGIAQRMLRGMGYRQSFNLGSYTRAAAVLQSHHTSAGAAKP